MRWALSFIGAAACGFVGYRIGTHGDLWLGLGIVGAGLVILLETAVHAKPDPVMPFDHFARWRQSGFFSPPPASLLPLPDEAGFAPLAGPVGAGPANRER